MSLSSHAKNISIATGLYRPARWLSLRLRPAQLRRFLDDQALYRSLIPAGSLCFDVGANIGAKSEALLLAGARVVAFEPSRQILSELHARCDSYPEWTVIEAALGSNAGVATLFTRRNHAQSSLAEDWEGVIDTSYSVPVITLDSAIRHFGRPYFCKVDVEGWELEVFRGLSQAIPLISTEFHLRTDDIEKTRACLAHLKQLGSTHVNVTPAENAGFLFKNWMPLDEFLQWFPGDLHKSLPSDQYGDIFVRSSGM